MRKYKNISKYCVNCGLILPILSFILFAGFMNYAASLNIANLENGDTLSYNNENIQDEYNYEYYIHIDDGVPSHALETNINSLHCIILNDIDDNYSRNSELTKPVSDDYSIKSDLDKSVRKYFINQLISQAKLPTEKALRFDILLI